MKIRSREIKEQVIAGLILAGILGAVAVIQAFVRGLPITAAATWLWGLLLKPLPIPAGLLLLAGLLAVPEALRLTRRLLGRSRSPGEAGSSRTGARRNATSLSADEQSVMMLFAHTGLPALPLPGIADHLGLAEIRLQYAVDQLASRGLLKAHPASWANDTPPELVLTPDGREWLVTSGHV